MKPHAISGLCCTLVTFAAAGCIAALAVQFSASLPATSASSSHIKSVIINRTRYFIHNLTLVKDSASAGNVAEDTYDEEYHVFHPFLASYFVHTIALLVAAVLGIHCKRALVVILAGAVITWPISGIWNIEIYGWVPGSVFWWLMFAKSIIVNWAPTVPMLLMGICKFSRSTRQRLGIWVYIAFWANIFWTLLFPMRDMVSRVNGLAGTMLCVSLIFRLFALSKADVDLFEVQGNMIYGYGTSLSYLVCYTVWNALFVADLAVGVTLQDILFWVLMCLYYYYDERKSAIEDYFAMARPIQLSTYVASSDITGMIPFFTSQRGVFIDVNKHPFFMFLAMMNFLFSFYVLHNDVNSYLNPDQLRKDKSGKMVFDENKEPACSDSAEVDASPLSVYGRQENTI